jgi:hypothetical protein
MFGEPIGKLAHVEHREFASVGGAIHASGDIGEFAIGHAYESVGSSGYPSCGGKLHGEVFELGHGAVDRALRFEDKVAPKAYDGKLLGFVLSASVDVERELGLYASD